MITITSRGIPEVQAWLKQLANDIKGIATKAVAEYLVGDQTHGLKHYVAYKYVSIAQAGGWASDKQRRYVMAKIREGKIDPGFPHRTGEMQRGWTYGAQGSRYVITNPTPYTKYVMGPGSQSRMHQMIGWRNTLSVVQSNMAGALRHAHARIREWIAAHKPH